MGGDLTDSPAHPSGDHNGEPLTLQNCNASQPEQVWAMGGHAGP
jgi:hypothetical protein